MSKSPEDWDIDGNSKSGSEEKFRVDETEFEEQYNPEEDEARPSSKRSITSRNSDSPLENKNSPGIEYKRKKRAKKEYEWHRMTFNKDLLKSRKIGSPESNGKKKGLIYINIANFPTHWSVEEVHDFIKKEYKPVDFLFISADKEMGFAGIVKLQLSDASEFANIFQCFHDKTLDDEFKLSVNISVSDNESDRSDTESSSSSQATRRKRQRRESERPWRPDVDVWEKDPTGMYGLKPEFLKMLGITPPIDKWVHVSNFRCDKAELKEVLELAGQVLYCTVDTKGPKFAKAMYSHPLEAVQAVSMLNKQNFYGSDLKVEICEPPVALLPKGLKGVGPGLGVEGKPLRDVVKQYERFVQSKSSSVNYTLFRSPDLLFDPAFSFERKNVDNERRMVPNRLSEPPSGPGPRSMQSFAASTPVQSAPRNVASQIKDPNGSMFRGSRPTAGSFSLSSAHGSGLLTGPSGPTPGSCGPMHGPSRPGPILGPTGPMPGMSGPMPGPSGPMPGPSGSMHGPPGPMPGAYGPMSGPSGPMPGPVGPMPGGPIAGPSGPISGPPGPICGPNTFSSIGPGGPGYNVPANGSKSGGPSDDCVTIELVNLPLSTTFPLLCEKMAQCGQVMSLQLTSPGCAVVQFAQRAQAQRCYQQYNGCCVLGNLIEVKFL